MVNLKPTSVFLWFQEGLVLVMQYFVGLIGAAFLFLVSATFGSGESFAQTKTTTEILADKPVEKEL